MKSLIELELIMNDEKQKCISDTPEIESQLLFKKKKNKKPQTQQIKQPNPPTLKLCWSIWNTRTNSLFLH